MREPLPRSRPLVHVTLALLAATLLGGCANEVLDPAGAVALQQRNLIYAATGLMLLIIVPVLILIVIFAWHYRKGNATATYDPHFDHSTSLELVIWSAPLLIIISLGALTWSSTHLLDPYRRLDKASAGTMVDANAKPLTVQVVSLDWKWLFIYPEQGIATVNALVLPVDRQVRFELTSTNMMNTFYAPTLAGMIYTMPGMTTQMHAVLNRPGRYAGLSANYSGAGFSDMRFTLYGLDAGGFDRWVAQTRGNGHALSTPTYLALERPSEKVPAMRFASVDARLFDRIVNRCVRPGTPCMRDVMARDMRAGGGRPGAVEAGSGMPATNAAPSVPGGKPEGALFKNGAEMAPAPNVTKPRRPGAPGAADPKSPRNRDMSFLLLPPAPATPARARG